MTSGVTRARATLDAWREHGADRLDPIRFHFIEALDRRAAGHSGEARRILDDRLSELLAAYAGDLERAGPKPGEPGGVTSSGGPSPDAPSPSVPSPGVPSPGEPARGPLAGLIDHIASHAPMDGDGPAAANAAPRRPSYPELEVLDYFRDIWSGLSTQRQLRQSLEQVPGNAGPLNSSSLVHRSLSLMRELSPGYLQQFLSYVDALSWMEQMNGGGESHHRNVSQGPSAGRRVRRKP